MIQKVSISNFKSIKKQDFEVYPLTILTGENSSGKSTFLQSILLFSYYSNQSPELEKALTKIRKFKDIKNFYDKKEESNLKLSINNKYFELNCSYTYDWSIDSNCGLKFEDNLYYISSNRIGQEDISRYSENIKFGINGQNVFGFFENHKNNPINFTNNQAFDDTLAGNLKYWIKEILDLDLEIYTQDIDGESIKVGYKISQTSNILSTFNVGSGVSYVIRILIMTLSLNKDSVFLVENPEIHLHPKAISGLANFFVFLASKGAQLIIETHSEHIINKMRHCVYKNEISKNSLVIYYKKDAMSSFDQININESGKFIDQSGSRVKFPEGFFDANSQELLDLI